MQEFTNEQVKLGQLPSIQALEYSPLASNYPTLSAVQTGIFWLIPVIPLIIIAIFVEDANIPLPVFFIPPVFSILGAFISFRAAKARGYSVREKDIIYKQGLLWKKQTCVSFKRIQHIDISHGPIERHFGLTSIKFFTAGGALADLKISGLENEKAEKLRSYILKKIGVNDEQSDQE